MYRKGGQTEKIGVNERGFKAFRWGNLVLVWLGPFNLPTSDNFNAELPLWVRSSEALNNA